MEKLLETISALSQNPQVKMLDNVLDTIVFGKPLGLFGENLKNQTEEKPKENLESIIDKFISNVEKQVEDKKLNCDDTAGWVEREVTPIGKAYLPQDNTHCVVVNTNAPGYVANTRMIITNKPKVIKFEENGRIFEELMVTAISVESGVEYEMRFNESWLNGWDME